MNSKERVRRAVTFTTPDQIPVDIWVLPAALERHGKELQELLRAFPKDFGEDGFVSPLPEEKLYEPGIVTDPWGSVWENTTRGIMGQVRHYPLNDWSNLEHYRPPYHLLGKGFEHVDEAMQRNAHKFILANGGSLFHRMCWLRDPHYLYIDLLEEKQEVFVLRDMIVEYLLKHLDFALKHDHDGVVFSDDWGTQTQLVISPVLWRKIFRPCYEELCNRVHAEERLIFFHSDGYILDIIGDLIDLKVSALNCQVACMGAHVLGERFKGKVCFWGELDRQHLLPRGNPRTIREAIRESVECFSVTTGGYIFQAELNADVPIENVRAMLEGWQEMAGVHRRPL
jgi:uroporphyrinogen decarboxylase